MDAVDYQGWEVPFSPSVGSDSLWFTSSRLCPETQRERTFFPQLGFGKSLGVSLDQLPSLAHRTMIVFAHKPVGKEAVLKRMGSSAQKKRLVLGSKTNRYPALWENMPTFYKLFILKLFQTYRRV